MIRLRSQAPRAPPCPMTRPALPRTQAGRPIVALSPSAEPGAASEIGAAAKKVYSTYDRNADALPTGNGMFSLNLVQGSVPFIASLLDLKDGDSVGWIGVGARHTKHRPQLA